MQVSNTSDIISITRNGFSITFNRPKTPPYNPVDQKVQDKQCAKDPFIFESFNSSFNSSAIENLKAWRDLCQNGKNGNVQKPKDVEQG